MKIAETEIETKINQFFCDFQTVLLSQEEDVAVIPSPAFTKKQKFREQNRVIFLISLSFCRSL